MDCNSRGRNILFNNFPHSQRGVSEASAEARRRPELQGSREGTHAPVNASWSGRRWGPAEEQARPVPHKDLLLNHTQLVQWHLSAFHWSRASMVRAPGKTIRPTWNKKHGCTQLRTATLFLHHHPKYGTGNSICIWRYNSPIQAISGQLKYYPWNMIRVPWLWQDSHHAKVPDFWYYAVWARNFAESLGNHTRFANAIQGRGESHAAGESPAACSTYNPIGVGFQVTEPFVSLKIAVIRRHLAGHPHPHF